MPAAPAADLVEAFAALDDPEPRPVPGVGDVLVLAHRPLPGVWAFEAWEPTPTVRSQHGLVRRMGPGRWYGSVASGPLPPGLPTEAERRQAIAGLQRASVLAVRLARPDVARLLDLGYGRIDGGRIEISAPR